ncbi:MAG: hypothetical protein COC22_05090, partial [Flavobacteriaceae bacterium]
MADSTIRDADLTEEIALLTRNQILSEVAVSMVGQTNLSGQNLLNLLQLIQKTFSYPSSGSDP